MRRAFLKQIMSVGALAVLGTLGLGCASGLGAARSRLDKNPTVAVVGTGQTMFFKGIDKQHKTAALPKDFDVVLQAIADAVKAGWPGAKVLPINDATGADLELSVDWYSVYSSTYNRSNMSEICDIGLRIEPIMKLVDAKSRVEIAGLWSLAVVMSDLPLGCEPHGALTVDQLMQKLPPAALAPETAQKVGLKARSIVAEIKAAKPE